MKSEREQKREALFHVLKLSRDYQAIVRKVEIFTQMTAKKHTTNGKRIVKINKGNY